MTAATTMPSSISSGSTDRRDETEAGPRGFTAVNITPPQSRGTHQKRTFLRDETNGSPESSATSPDDSPKHGRSDSKGTNFHHAEENANHKRTRSALSEHSHTSRRYDHAPPKRHDSSQQQQHTANHALVFNAAEHQQNGYYSNSSNELGHYNYGGPAHNSIPKTSHESHIPGEGNDMRDLNDSGDQDRYDEGSQSPATLPAGQKRKRNFSNRTKTGCMTCRTRKKKCDEGRPHCQLCVRGGYECKGYQPRAAPSAWANPNSQKQPITPMQREGEDQMMFDNTTTPMSANPANADLMTAQMRPGSNMVADGHDQSRPPQIPNTTQPAPARPPYPNQQQQQQPSQQMQWPQYNNPLIPSPSVMTQHPPIPYQHHQHRHSSLGNENHQSKPMEQHPLPPPQGRDSSVVAPAQQQHQQQHHPQQTHQDHSSTPQRDTYRQVPSTPSMPQLVQPTNWPQQQQQPQQRPLSQHQGAPLPGLPQLPPQPSQSAHGPHQQVPYPNVPPPPPAPSQVQQQEHLARQRPFPPLIDTNQPQQPQTGQKHTANTANTAITANTATPSFTPSEQRPIHKVFTNEDVERSRMLRGAPYNYFDKTLHNERQRCATALQRYNNACQLGSGVSDPELQNILLKVFVPKKDQTHSFLAANPLEGTLGPGVRIEPGFRCTYGYNLRIMDNVFIGENTRIDDSGRVDIGSRTWIGANVTMLTNDVIRELQNRKGTDGQLCQTAHIMIGSEAVIGPGAVIYPGCRLGRGCTVEPFAIVKGNLGDYEVQKAYEGHRFTPHTMAYPMAGGHT